MRPLLVVLFCLLLLPARSEDPPRVLSLAPSITEMVYTLDAGDLVVGVTDYCRFPQEAAEKPKVGGYLNPNFERMVALRPTVALLTPGETDLDRRLGGAGIRTVAVRTETLADIREGLLAIGRELGHEEEAKGAVQTFEGELAALREAGRELGEPRVLLVLGRPMGPVREIFSAGPGTFVDELMTAAGARNVLEGTKVPYPTVSREFLIANPPDVVVETRSGELDYTEAEKEEARVAWKRALGPGATGTRILFLNDPHLTIPGPGVVASARRLQSLLAKREPAPAP